MARGRWKKVDGIPSTLNGGIYALYRAGALVYVGRTGNLRSRIISHRNRIDFDSCKISLTYGWSEMKWRERRLLWRLRPVMNRQIPTALYANGYQRMGR